MFDFEGKVVLITGGSRGLGRAMSRGFARAGARVIVASRKLDGCQAVVDSIVEEGGEAWACAANTSSTEDLDRLVTSSLEHYGHVDILINNAGTNIARGPLTDVTADAFDKMYQVNQRGPWYLASRLAPHMAENGGGVVINVLSVAALKPPAYTGFYAATKAALQALTKVMAQEWAPMKIRVNAIAPGSYHSDLTDSAISAIPGFEEGMLSANLIKRIPESEEILLPIFYLAAETYTTGFTLVADGGMTAT
ncbi:SDR family NAD(P)-dependent oxidoreductase [Pseudohalioglobus lutimaris]|uniref:3-oxoacyl-ACP reductase n=1 Tax=Pseudohalioglobus lutimaris TaxID=1737061 RepID=A0A2N5X573_9GAMM|nr:glucose 1-dehydrogenase [Pseudohalioglobus lutimaris]PLW69628.1 3-oxoacyl-ACP reductase [Pseudohalioglobus lutimaris]